MSIEFAPSARAEILNALEQELGCAGSPVAFVVEALRRVERYWEVTLDSEQGSLRGLDESLEGYAAWWATPGGAKNGTGDVLAVVPETQMVTLRYCSTSPPDPGEKLFIYPPLFLEGIRNAWSDGDWARQCLAWAEGVEAGSRRVFDWGLDASSFPWLRCAQRKALALPGWSAGFLWGPPGTGKTTTLGVLIAQALIQCPDARILLTSTTNNAVDLALVAVDKALEEVGKHRPDVEALRRRCKRVGQHFVAANYQDRRHLLPVLDEGLIRRVVELETRRPDPADTTAYGAWKGEVDEVRSQMRKASLEVLVSARLIAMTTTRAAFSLNDLRGAPPFDLLVMDEASQVSLPHCLGLAPLALSMILAGDPKQLSPIVQCKEPGCQKWLGASGFSLMDGESLATCFLDEQSRMHASICEVVSKVFYEGKLRVAEDALEDPTWLKARDVAPDRNLTAKRVTEAGTWSHVFGGAVRNCSAEEASDIVARLVGFEDRENIIVLTPFRAQRALIRAKFRSANLRVLVSTVHRAQGGERDIVIFDCVDGGGGFLNCEEGSRLINVALSRAKKQLYILWSDGDCENEVLDRVIRLAKTQGFARFAKPIHEFCGRPDFPTCVIGAVVTIGNITCDVAGVEPDRSRFWGTDIETGRKRTFVTDYVRKKFCQ